MRIASIILSILVRDVDRDDPHIPLLLWWAVEHHAIAARNEVTAVFSSPDAWRSLLCRSEILPRLARRYVAEGSPDTDEACRQLVRSAADEKQRALLWASMELGFRDRPMTPDMDSKLAKAIREYGHLEPEHPPLTRLSARCGDAAARDRLLDWARDRKRPPDARIAAIATFAGVAASSASRPLLDIVAREDEATVRSAALSGWARLGNDTEAKELIRLYEKVPPVLQSRLRSTLLSRKSWAALVLKAVDAGGILAKDFAAEDLFAARAHADSGLDELVRKHWGNIRSATPGQKLAEVRRLNNDLRAATGDSKAGRTLFAKHCAACHRLNGEGGTIGPDLTHANRADRDYLLVNLVDPSAVIRREYLSYTAETRDGRRITGIITAQDAQTVTLTDAKAEATTLKRDEIESLRESAVSLMPEGLLTALKPHELRDLFAYLQGEPKH